MSVLALRRKLATYHRFERARATAALFTSSPNIGTARQRRLGGSTPTSGAPAAAVHDKRQKPAQSALTCHPSRPDHLNPPLGALPRGGGPLKHEPDACQVAQAWSLRQFYPLRHRAVAAPGVTQSQHPRTSRISSARCSSSTSSRRSRSSSSSSEGIGGARGGSGGHDRGRDGLKADAREDATGGDRSRGRGKGSAGDSGRGGDKDRDGDRDRNRERPGDIAGDIGRDRKGDGDRGRDRERAGDRGKGTGTDRDTDGDTRVGQRDTAGDRGFNEAGGEKGRDRDRGTDRWRHGTGDREKGGDGRRAAVVWQRNAFRNGATDADPEQARWERVRDTCRALEQARARLAPPPPPPPPCIGRPDAAKAQVRSPPASWHAENNRVIGKALRAWAPRLDNQLLTAVLKKQRHDLPAALAFFRWALTQPPWAGGRARAARAGAYNTMIGLCGRAGELEHMHALVDEMQSCGAGGGSGGSMGGGGGGGGCGSAGLGGGALTPNIATYNRLLEAYGRACGEGEGEEGAQLMVERVRALVLGMETDGLAFSFETYSSLMDVYCRAGLHDAAVRTFHALVRAGLSPSALLYNRLMWAHGQLGEWPKALRAFALMKAQHAHHQQQRQQQWQQDDGQWEEGQRRERQEQQGEPQDGRQDAREERQRQWQWQKQWQEELQWQEQQQNPQQQHQQQDKEIKEEFNSCIISSSSSSSRGSSGSSGSGNSSGSGGSDNDIHETEAGSSGSSGRSGSSQGAGGAGGRGCRPNSVTYNTLIQICSRAGRAHTGLDLYEEMRACQVARTRVTYDAVVEMCANAGMLGEAEAALGEMGARALAPSARAWTALVRAHAAAGDTWRAVEAFRRMTRAGCAPSVIAYNELLAAFLRARLLPEARRLVGTLTRHHAPALRTYALLLDTCTELEDPECADAAFEFLVRLGHPAHSLVTLLLQPPPSPSPPPPPPSSPPLPPPLPLALALQRGGQPQQQHREQQQEQQDQEEQPAQAGTGAPPWAARAALEANRKLWAEVDAHLDILQEEDEGTRQRFANTLTRFLWRCGLRRRAGLLWAALQGRGVHPLKEMTTTGGDGQALLALDVHGLPLENALLAVLCRLASWRQLALGGARLPGDIHLITGWSKRSEEWAGGGGGSSTKRALEEMAEAMDLPFAEDASNTGRLQARGESLRLWLLRPEAEAALQLTDDDEALFLGDRIREWTASMKRESSEREEDSKCGEESGRDASGQAGAGAGAEGEVRAGAWAGVRAGEEAEGEALEL